MKKEPFIRVIATVLAVTLTGCGVSPAASDKTTETVLQGTGDVLATTETTTDTEIETTAETAAVEEVVVIQNTEPEDEDTLDQSQLNSIAWLNYLAALSQKINASKHSRLFLEEAYASLISNTNPENVNDRTQSHLASLLDTIESYRMIDVKRERLQFIYEQNKARAVKESMPDPIGLLSTVNSFDVKKLVFSLAYMAIDSVSSYKAYNASVNQEFLMDGWELDDEEAEQLHFSRKLAFNYMLDIVQEQNIPGKLALSEKDIEDFVSCVENPNVFQRLQFLETEYDTYQAFGDYWLALIDCYFVREDYQKCLAAAKQYEQLQSGIFRKDYYWARALPKVIVAARESYDQEQYVSEAEHYLELIKANTERSDWSLKYFAAEMYTDLYAKTKNNAYLTEAYTLIVNNINELVVEQTNLNQVYLADVQEVELPELPKKDEKNKGNISAIKAERERIEEYNNSLHEQRKIELPPVYEPLKLNLEFLSALIEELPVSEVDKQWVDGILHGSGPLFLSEPLEMKYSSEKQPIEYVGTLKRSGFTIPLSAVTDESFIRVTVTGTDGKNIYTDWIVKKVDREDGEFGDYTVTYESKLFEDQKWDDTCEVQIELFTTESDKAPSVDFQFKVNKCTAWGKYVTFEQVM